MAGENLARTWHLPDLRFKNPRIADLRRPAWTQPPKSRAGPARMRLRLRPIRKLKSSSDGSVASHKSTLLSTVKHQATPDDHIMNDPLEEEDKENTAPAQESVTRGKATPPPLSFQEYQYTPYEELLLTRAAHLTERSFPVGTVYESEKILKDSFYQWGLEQGVLICVKHRHFVCSKKHGLMPSELKRTQVRQASSQHAKTRTKKTTRCGCKFKIRYVPAGPEHPPGAVRITSGSYYAHTNGCVPSRDQLLGDMHQLGKLTDLRKLTQTASNLFHVRAIAVIVKAPTGLLLQEGRSQCRCRR